MRFRISLLAIVCVVVGCATHALVNFRTESSTATEYYAVPTYEWENLGSTDAARVVAISGEPLYGPFAANQLEALYDRTNYVFIPVCNGQILADKKRLALVRRSGSTSVEC